MKILKFYADWCNPCKMYSPIVEKVAKELDITVEDINIEHNDDLVATHVVRTVPTLVVLDDNDKVVKKLDQRMTEAELKKTLTDIKEIDTLSEIEL